MLSVCITCRLTLQRTDKRKHCSATIKGSSEAPTVHSHDRMGRTLVHLDLDRNAGLLELLAVRDALVAEDVELGDGDPRGGRGGEGRVLCMKDLEWDELRDGQALERLRAGRAERQHGIIPVLAGVLTDVGAVEQDDVRGRLSVRGARVQVVMRLPLDAGDDCGILQGAVSELEGEV